jgi:pimeloyl-ACP methyl ester carboxylesterase
MSKWHFVLVLAILLPNDGCSPRGTMGDGDNVSTLESKPLESGQAPVNGINMYYEVHGRREGGRRRVIALEEQAHGRTTDRNTPVAFESSADDVAALLRYLKVDKADILGFSNGASIALQVAIRHPHLVRKMVFASSITKRTGAQPQLWEFMKQADFSSMPQQLKDAFLLVNPDVQQLKTMHDKDVARMQSFRDVPDDAVRSVGVPTLIVLGDQDIVTPECLRADSPHFRRTPADPARWARRLSWRSRHDAEADAISRANRAADRGVPRL